MFSHIIQLTLCKRLVSNIYMCNKMADRHYNYMHRMKYKENSDRLSAIIDRRRRVKQYTNNSRGMLSMNKNPVRFSVENIQRWVYYKGLQASLKRQSYDLEKIHKLGNDLAAADFILHLGGRVKFHNFMHWTELVDYKNLPKVYDNRYVIVAIDASPLTFLRYEGLDNILGLTRLKWLSLNGCIFMDDWCLDRLSAEYLGLEYLDISNCTKITDRGLECLYKLTNLKTLIVTNFNKSVTLELTCMLLEECIPGLTCKICSPPSNSYE